MESGAEIQNEYKLKTGYLFAVLIFSILGAGLAFYATGLTFKLTVSGFIDPAGCSYNDWISCDIVLATNYARMFGVPVAWWGFLFYIWAAGAFIYAFIKRTTASGYGSIITVLLVSFLAVLFTFFKMYQLFILEVLCPVCAGMYIANFGIFFFSMKTANITGFKSFKNSLGSFFKPHRGERQVPHPFRYFVFIIWVFAMGFLGMKYYENVSVKPNSANIQAALTRHYSQEQVKINTDNAPVTGNPAAEIKIVEFSDFECPACKLLSDNMKIILLDYGNDAALYYMNYPLDKSINPVLKNEIHKNAGLAAIAGVAAQNQNDFWNYQYKIFENQTKIDREFLIQLAVEQGLDKEKFISDIDSEETKVRVIEDIAEAKKIGVNATPSVFINGRKVEYWNSPEIIRAIIEEEMKKIKE